MILQMVGVDRAKLPQEYLDLLKLLGGHPLSFRVILPHLKTQTPSQLIEALRLGLDTLDYSFSKLSEKARRHLPFLGLFSERVNIDMLSGFTQDFGFEDLLKFQRICSLCFNIDIP